MLCLSGTVHTYAHICAEICVTTYRMDANFHGFQIFVDFVGLISTKKQNFIYKVFNYMSQKHKVVLVSHTMKI